MKIDIDQDEARLVAALLRDDARKLQLYAKQTDPADATSEELDRLRRMSKRGFDLARRFS